MLLLFSCETEKGNKIESESKTMSDSTYIIIDTIITNTKDTSFDYHLVFSSDNNIYEVYRMTDKFNTGEFKFDYNYSDNKNSFAVFYENNLVDGSSMGIYFDKRSRSFYQSEWSNTLSLNGTIDFKNGILRGFILEAPHCGDTKEIKLTKIWEPTDEFKKKTLIKSK